MIHVPQHCLLLSHWKDFLFLNLENDYTPTMPKTSMFLLLPPPSVSGLLDTSILWSLGYMWDGMLACGAGLHGSQRVYLCSRPNNLLLLNLQGPWNRSLLGDHLNLPQNWISLLWGILQVSLKETGLEREIKRGPGEKVLRCEDGKQCRPWWGVAEVLGKKWLGPTIWKSCYCHQWPVSLEDDSLGTPDSWCIASAPFFLCPWSHCMCPERSQREDRYYCILKNSGVSQPIWMQKNTREGNRAWTQGSRTWNFDWKGPFTSCMTFLFPFFICKIEKLIITPWWVSITSRCRTLTLTLLQSLRRVGFCIRFN